MVGFAVLVDAQDIAVGPGVGAVQGNVNRNVSKETDSALLCIELEFTPLAVEKELRQDGE